LIGYRPLFACSVLAVSGALFGCGGNDDKSGQSPTASPAVTTPLTVTQWAEQVCTLSVDAADALNTDPVDTSVMSLDERRQRAAEVLAPRAATLGDVAREISGLQSLQLTAEFHTVLHTTMADVAAAWQRLVDTAKNAQSVDELNAANDAFTHAQDLADAKVVIAYGALDGQATAALSQPADCGVLNNIRT
jgi:hypothetical protein